MVGELRDRAFGTDQGDFYSFVPRITPSFQPPYHMRPLVDLLMAAAHDPPVFACTSFPSQVGKSESWLHGFAWLLAENPKLNIGYITYGQELADEKSAYARGYAVRAGVQISTDTRSKKNWRTVAGGGMRARGYNAPITGLDGLDIIVIDDPYKDMAHAMSKTVRNHVDAGLWSTIWSRRHEKTSILVNHTRWHTDDQIGRIKKRVDRGEVNEPWRFVNVPAVDEDGHSFCPNLRSDDFWADARRAAKEMFWWPIYMGQPRPITGRLFEGVAFYEALPSAYSIGIGVDLAYTESQKADHSSAVVMARADNRCYVLEVIRRQCQAPDFAEDLRGLNAKYPGAPMLIYSGGGGEKGAINFMQRAGVGIESRPAHRDKKVRALPAAAAWNDEQILVPREASWLEAFTEEVLDFSGEGDDATDDQIDALAAGYDVLNEAPAFVDRPRGSRPTPYDVGRRTSHRSRRATHY